MMLSFLSRLLPRRPANVNARVCMATVLNDAFVEYFIVLLHSIRKHNPWFAQEIVIMHGTTMSLLSDANKNLIRRTYPHVTFLAVDEAPYEHFHVDTPKSHWPALLKLAAFRIKNYDRVVFIDSDILCLGDIKLLFTLDVPFAACPAGKNSERKRSVAHTSRRRVGINSGVMVIGKEYLNEATHGALMKYKSGPCADQDVLLGFLRWKRVYCLPHEYNFHAEFFWQDDHRTADDVRLLHYAGVKPLQKPELPRMKVWFEAREEIQNRV